MHVMNYLRITRRGEALLVAAFALSFGLASTAAVPSVPARVVGPLDMSDTVTLPGNTYRLATPAADQGLVSGEEPLGPLFIALKRSPAQESALAAFNARQLDAASPDYHHWLQAPTMQTSRRSRLGSGRQVCRSKTSARVESASNSPAPRRRCKRPSESKCTAIS